MSRGTGTHRDAPGRAFNPNGRHYVALLVLGHCGKAFRHVQVMCPTTLQRVFWQWAICTARGDEPRQVGRAGVHLTIVGRAAKFSNMSGRVRTHRDKPERAPRMRDESGHGIWATRGARGHTPGRVFRKWGAPWPRNTPGAN